MIRGTKRDLETRPSINVDLKASIHNRFDVEVIDAKTGELKQRAQAFNVVCDGYWANLNGWKVYNIEFGGGSGTPSASDTSLFSPIGYVTAQGSAVFELNKEKRWVSARYKISLSESQYVGKTFTEVGCSSSNRVLTTHAMLQDMNGNPVSILKTDTDIINIYATIFVHWSDSYADGAINVYFGNFEGGHNMVKSFISGHGFSFGSQIQFLRGSLLSTYGTNYGIAGSTSISTSYDATARKATLKATRVPVANANASGGTLKLALGATSSGNTSHFPLIIDCGKALPHSVITGESVATGDGSTADFATKFSPAYDIEVYVDGVLASDVTVDENVPTNFSEIMGVCFDPVASATDILPSTKYASFPTLAGSQNQNNCSRMAVYNPYWEKGIATIVPHNPGVYPMKIEATNDLSSWTTLYDGTAPSPNFAVPEEYQNSKYFAFSGSNIDKIIARDILPTNIHFATPPAAGSVITANYKAKCIAKDENHVFDFSMSITFGEYTED